MNTYAVPVFLICPLYLLFLSQLRQRPLQTGTWLIVGRLHVSPVRSIEAAAVVALSDVFVFA